MAALTAIALWQFGGAGVIHAKAWLTPVLIERAWHKMREEDGLADGDLADGGMVRPWPWADTWPVAKLSVPSLGIEQYVLAGANGASLPFGPGHISGSAQPGETGTIAIAGHRDTHFRFLERLSSGDEIHLKTTDQGVQVFAVSHRAIVDARTQGIEPATTDSELVLVTCEPTNAFTYRGPYRLVVTAAATH